VKDPNGTTIYYLGENIDEKEKANKCKSCFSTVPVVQDPGSGAFYPPGSGMLLSRIRPIFVLRLLTNFVNDLYTKIGRIRDPVLFYLPDPGYRIRDGAMVGSGSGIKHP
jgi:hypothetical protein